MSEAEIRDRAVGDCREAIVYLNQKAHEMAEHLPVNYEMNFRVVTMFGFLKDLLCAFEGIEKELTK